MTVPNGTLRRVKEDTVHDETKTRGVKTGSPSQSEAWLPAQPALDNTAPLCFGVCPSSGALHVAYIVLNITENAKK